MGVFEKLNFGLVGAAGRGGSFWSALQANGARVQAVCDVREDALDRCAAESGAAEKYSDYAEMLEKSNLDAVIIGTPQHLHVPQAVLALRKGIHVLSEVPAGISLDQCKELEQACSVSAGIYMMAENYTYTLHNVLVRELVRQGLFGDLYYAEGEYLHDLRDLAEVTKWRRHWQMGIDGVTYPTHSLGPILQWMAGDRVSRVACEGSGHHYLDPRGDPYHQDTSVMLCKTARGALIKIRIDLVSNRPDAWNNYQLQGTTGAYESSRGGGDPPRIWLSALSKEIRWHDMDALVRIDNLAERFMPDTWRNPPPEAVSAGHGGGDFFEVRDFVRAIRCEAPCPVGIHEALDMTLPGILSQQSILNGGAWMGVPDSRTWRQAKEQLQMTVPETSLDSIPPPAIPDGYVLRCYQDSDESDYIRLMDGAGFKGWTHESVTGAISTVLPGGFFLIEHRHTGKLVATAMAQHKPTDQHPYGGELGWVAGDPDHSGRGLGMAVCSAATRRLVQGGYRRIYLKTDDFRLPAINIYLKLGYRPFLFCDGMPERWDSVYGKLKWGEPR